MADRAWPMAAVRADRGVRAESTPRLPWPEVVAMVRRQMRSIVGATQDLDDLAQVALERTLRGARRFEGRAEFSTYTYRVCARVALNHWRWWRRWMRRFQLGNQEAAERAASSSDPRTELYQRVRARRLRALLDRMDPVRRLVVTLADLEDMPTQHIAQILDCPEPTVRSRLRLAREDLAALIARDPFFREERKVLVP